MFNRHRPDKVGICGTVRPFCVEHNINILDLSTTAHDGIYMMILDARHQPVHLHRGMCAAICRILKANRF
jgi:hypothetical protein